LMDFFVREHGGGHMWGVWMFSFPTLTRCAADRSEAACLSWLAAEVLPPYAPPLIRRVVLDAKQWMWVRLYDPSA
jgi:hypothetical protein